MKICAAQTKPVKGDIESNIANHKKLIGLAISEKADIIIFPELSITGYEPELAQLLSTDINDSRLNEFQTLTDLHNIIIGVGAPLKSKNGISISMIIFQPAQPRQVYSKKYLHADEVPYFISGESSIETVGGNVGFAICYEISVSEHAANASKVGTKNYIASVAKSVGGMEKAFENLSGIAASYSMTVLMSNCIGQCDNFECGGKSAAWNEKGSLLGQMDESSEGILVVDTSTHEVMIRMI